MTDKPGCHYCKTTGRELRLEVNNTVKIRGTDVVGVVTSFSSSTVNIEAEEGTEYIVPHGAVQIVERWTGVDGRCP